MLNRKFDLILDSKEDKLLALKVISVFIDELSDELAEDVRHESIMGLNFKKLTVRQKNAIENWVGYNLSRKAYQATEELKRLKGIKGDKQ